MNTNEKLREALETIVRATYDITLRDSTVRDFVKHFAKEALALPRRNCDVGTDVEQSERYKKFCKKQGNKCAYGGKGSCPIFKEYKIDCGLTWEQLPYEKEGI